MNALTKKIETEIEEAGGNVDRSLVEPWRREQAANGRLNDAAVSCADCPEWRELLARPMTFLLPKDRTRDEKQSEWKNQTATWNDWLSGDLTKHAVKSKKGYFPAVFAASAGEGYVPRKADGIKAIEVVGLDVDSGDNYDDALDRVEKMGLACVAYTSFNDGKTTTKLKRDDVLRKLKIEDDREPTLAEMRALLADKLRPHVLDTLKIEGVEQDAEAVKIALSHAPLEKFRLLFPLEEPLRVMGLGARQRAAQEAYKDHVRGLAAKLDLMVDEACLDVSRVFFLPSHPKGAKPELDVLRGRGLRLEDMPKAKKTAGKNAFEIAGEGAERDDRRIGDLPALKWAAQYGGRLLIADLVEAHAPDKVRKSISGGVVVACPFDGEHSNACDEGDTACHVRNADDSGFGWKCLHGSCADRDRLDFVAEALAQGWFEADALTDEAYLLPLPDADLAALEAKGQDEGQTRFHKVLDPLYDPALVDEAGFLVTPDAAPAVYARYGVRIGTDKGAPEKAYRRLVSIAREQIKDAMRARFSYVIFGDAKAAIRTAPGVEVTFYTEGALERLFRNVEISYEEGDKVKTLKPATLFMYDRARDTFSRTAFEPDAKKAEKARDEGAYNLWTGYKVQPEKGDWSKLRNHVLNVLCGGNEEHFAWVMTFAASPFARPGVKVPSSIAFTGAQGTGKSKFFDWLREAMGCAALKVSQGKHLVGSFNAHLDGKLLVVAEEAFWAGDKAAAGVIKDLISSDTLTIEAKFENAVTRPNYVSVVFISNEEWIIPTDGADARRFFVRNVGDARKEDFAYFAAIDAQMKAGGLEAMVYELTNWNPEEHGLTWDSLRTPPKTDALKAQTGMGLSGPMAALVAALEEGTIEGRTDSGDVFFYDLNEDEETRVARPHISAILGIKKGRGNETVEGRRALETLFGKEALNDNKADVPYFGEVNEGSRVNKTAWNARFVTVPPMQAVRETLKQYGRG